ncbi:MAG: class A beta-lactamase-related serine hydrolase [Gammaproteobacteria bacterium]|nr:class A beta-lactamase-related serine hydrolase [Gammaproteobacteria bacterium]
MNPSDLRVLDARLTRRNLLGLTAGVALTQLGLPEPALAAKSAALDVRINDYIQKLRRAGRIAPNERTAWSVYDFHQGKKLVSINENRPMQSASMIKLFVVQAYFYQNRANPKRFPYNTKIRRIVESMIRDSNNRATNQLMRLVSGRGKKSRPQDVTRVLKRYASGIFANTAIVEYIPRNGRSYRNVASARDYSRFFYATWNDHLPGSKELKRVMRLRNHDRIAMGSKTIPRNVRVYDKTGTTARMCGNAGIVELPGRHANDAYTFIGIIDKAQRTKRYTAWLSERADIILSVSEIVYKEIARHRQRITA